MRSWLLTSTTYGTWLPGDARGFVGRVTDAREGDGPLKRRIEHDAPGAEYDRDVPGLRRSALELMRGGPVWLTAEQAGVVAAQFGVTSTHRGWELLAVAVMANHFHAVLSAAEDVPADVLLRDVKCYAARELNRLWPRPASGTWWTASGSRRLLPDSDSVERAIRYVSNQHACLAWWQSSSAG